jgi:hypothetical protein
LIAAAERRYRKVTDVVEVGDDGEQEDGKEKKEPPLHQGSRFPSSRCEGFTSEACGLSPGCIY